MKKESLKARALASHTDDGLGASEWNYRDSIKSLQSVPTDNTEERTVCIDYNSFSTIGRARIELTCVPFLG